MTTQSPVTEALHHQLADTARNHGITDLAVAAVITDHEQHTLLLRRDVADEHPDHCWDLPTSPVGKSLRREVRDRMLAREDS